VVLLPDTVGQVVSPHSAPAAPEQPRPHPPPQHPHRPPRFQRTVRVVARRERLARAPHLATAALCTGGAEAVLHTVEAGVSPALERVSSVGSLQPGKGSYFIFESTLNKSSK
jgi:hypothetical protein